MAVRRRFVSNKESPHLGGYLLYRLWPEQKIFMDGHTHIYGDALSRECVTVMARLSGWQVVLNKYQIRWVILQHDNPLALSLFENGWQVIYRDGLAVILSATPAGLP